ncbi:hypothetical protein IFM89_027339 [Coptis chinensis]|uniref:Uncharacterized protein n=1 Tax=Coptis chinensis TaxID=261450 RepID=A0A835GY97_9MAGN|nr:hypothetical protein IFM89_027339 [Coptis chinensis]
MLNSIKGSLNCLYVVFAFISALLLGALKVFFGIWLGLGIACSVLLGAGYGFVHILHVLPMGLIGLLVEIPLYTIIAIVKSPYLLFIGWYRLLHDLISREGPFLETACIPMRERSFRRGAAYVVAMVAEFDEYTNDWLYLREGSILPKIGIGVLILRSMLALSGISPMISALSMDDSKSTSPIYLLPRFPNEIVEDRDWRVPIEAPKQMWLLHVGNALSGGM